MKNVWNFFRGKGFYIVLGVGLVAFITLVSVYSYRRNVDSLDKNNGVDLNQPAQPINDHSADKADADSSNQTQDESKKNEQQTASNKTTESATQSTENEVAATKEPTADKASNDNEEAEKAAQIPEGEQGEPVDSEVVGVVSDGASPDKTAEIEAGLEYDGEARLIWPVVGNIIIPYSMETTVYFPTLNAYKCNPGMMIAGEEGTQVLSAYEGVVTDITFDPDKGNLVIISLGNGYKVTYGQITNITVEKGSTVSTGQQIGTIAQSTNHYTKEGSHLYLEMRKDGASVNPMLYFQE